MANGLEWSAFRDIELQPWFSNEAQVALECYTANRQIVERKRAECDAEYAALQAIPLTGGDKKGPKPADIPGRATALRAKVMETRHAEIAVRSEFRQLTQYIVRDAGAEAIRLEQKLAETERELIRWFEVGPEGIGGYVAYNGVEPVAGTWEPVMVRRHPRIRALRTAIEDCRLQWVADFNRLNDEATVNARKQMEAAHAALLSV